MDKQQETVSLGTYISQAHRDKLNRLKEAGLTISFSVEQGIDLFYEKMVKAELVGQDQRPVKQGVR